MQVWGGEGVTHGTVVVTALRGVVVVEAYLVEFLGVPALLVALLHGAIAGALVAPVSLPDSEAFVLVFLDVYFYRIISDILKSNFIILS